MIDFDDELSFGLGDNSTQIEKSQSPPTVRRRPAPQRRESILSAPRTGRVSTPHQVWDTIRPRSPGRSRTDAAFIDRQRGAERVSPIRERDSQSAVRRVEEDRSRKRGRELTETDSDDSFDHDDRLPKTSRRRAEKPRQTGSKRARREQPERREAVSAHGRGQDDLEEPAPEPARQRTVERNQVAASRRLDQTKPTSKRAWAESEDRRLLRLMEETGISWATIEKQNLMQPVQAGEERFVNRDQVALKDRARNMKLNAIRYVTFAV